jgi:hypothetical protein
MSADLAMCIFWTLACLWLGRRRGHYLAAEEIATTALRTNGLSA